MGPSWHDTRAPHLARYVSSTCTSFWLDIGSPIAPRLARHVNPMWADMGDCRSSVELDQLCLHECTILGKGGAHWPQPTYKVVAMDRADEPLLAKSCTGCWTQVRPSSLLLSLGTSFMVCDNHRVGRCVASRIAVLQCLLA